MATRSLGVLTLDLAVKTGAFISGMTKAERATDKSLRNIERKAAAFGRTIGNALGLSLSGALTAGVVAIDKAIDRMDELRDLSIRLGIGVETLSAFGYAAQQTGTDIDSLAKGLKILAKNAADALNPKSSKADIFGALGVSVKDAEGNLKSLEELVPELAGALSQLEDGTQKAAVMLELFGKTGLDLTEFFNQGDEGLKKLIDRAHELGVTFGQDAADQADAFKDNIADLKAAVLGLATGVANELLPDLVRLTRAAADWVSEGDNAKVVAGELRAVFSGLAETASFLWNVFDTGAMTLKGVAYDLGAVYKLLQAGSKIRFGDFAGAEESFKQAGEFRRIAGDASRQIEAGWTEFNTTYAKGAKEAQKTVAQYGPAFAIPGLTGQQQFDATATPFTAVGTGRKTVDEARLANALAGIRDPTPKKPKKGGKSDEEKALEEMRRAAERAREAVTDLNASYAEQIALFGETSEAAKLRYQFEHEDITKLDAETQKFVQTQRDLAIANAERLDTLREEKEVQDELNRVNEQRAEAVQQVLDDIQQQKDLLGATAEEQDTYNKLLYAGVDANSAFGQAIVQANHELHEQAKAVALQTEAMDIVRDGVKDIASDLVDMARTGASAWDILREGIDAVAASLTKMILNNLVERALGEAGSTSGGSSGDWIGKALGWLFGASGGSGASTGSFVGPRAIGGVALAGGLYPVAEHQPELLTVGRDHFLLMGSQNGQVSTMRETNNMGGNSVTVVQNFDKNVGRRTLEQAARKAGAAASRGLSRTGSTV